MIVEKTLQSFKDIHEWKMSVGLSKSLINVLIYDRRTLYSLSKQDSSNLLINLNCLDFSYEYDNLFQENTFYSYLKTLKKDFLKVFLMFLNMNKKLFLEIDYHIHIKNLNNPD